MEEVDVVDPRNNVVGTVTKQEAHEKGLLHRTVIAEIRDSFGNWVLVRPADHKQDAGQYVSPFGGHVMAGETEDDALIREAWEEMGIDEFAFRPLGTCIYDRVVRGVRENHYFIVYEITKNPPYRLNEESTEYSTFSTEELRAELKRHPERFGDAFHAILRQGPHPELNG